MDQIERYLTQVSRSIDGPEELRAHLRQEIRTHLEQLIEEAIRAGLSPDEATARAIESFGEPASVREGLESVHGRRHLAFLIEKAMDWKERTMKTSWKWSSIATTLVVLAVGLQAALIGFVVTFIVPKMHELTEGRSQFAHSTESVARLFANNSGYILALAVVGWALFEWRVKSENKSLMRVTGGIAATLVLGMVACYLCAGTMISFCMLTSNLVHP